MKDSIAAAKTKFGTGCLELACDKLNDFVQERHEVVFDYLNNSISLITFDKCEGESCG